MFEGDMPLYKARELLFKHIDEGVECPCCKKWAQRYIRKVDSLMARYLISLYEAHRRTKKTWVKFLEVTKGNTHGTYYYSRHWGLSETQNESTEKRRGTGLWRLTNKGRDFVLGKISIPKLARIYRNEADWFSPEEIHIRDALGKEFNYKELMQGECDGKKVHVQEDPGERRPPHFPDRV
jgi:hypothetical protein